MRTRLSICNRKVRYASGRDAHLAAAGATIVLRAYRCDRCRQFHLTSRIKGKRIPRPARSPGETHMPLRRSPIAHSAIEGETS